MSRTGKGHRYRHRKESAVAFEPPPRGCRRCFGYLEEIAALTKTIQDLKEKVSYYEASAGTSNTAFNMAKLNASLKFSKSTTLPALGSQRRNENVKPEKSPSFNRHKTTLHVYPSTANSLKKKGNPKDWFSPDVLIPSPDYYSIDNSGPSSDESESEDDESRNRSRASSVSSRLSLRGQKSVPVSSKASSMIEDDDEERPEVSIDGSMLGDEVEEEEAESQCSEWEDRFPYEENLFALSRDFQIECRIATAEDAIVYKATRRKNGEEVAIKFRDEWNRRGKHPKELRLLAAVQGHPVMCELVCWHNLPQTKCHAIVTKLYANTDIEQFLFGNPEKIRRYMHDLMQVVKFLHQRNVLYRDVKPSNVLWDEDNARATLIDFDVATFFNAERRHRRCVGTDGYMAPEVLLVSNAFDELEKQPRYQNRKNRDELLSKLPMIGYGLEVDVYSSGVLFGQLIFCYPEEDITDDDNTDCSGKGMSIKASKRLAKLGKLRAYLGEDAEIEEEGNDSSKPRRMALSEVREQLALDLLVKMLKSDPADRISVQNVLNHAYFTDISAFDVLPPPSALFDRNTPVPLAAYEGKAFSFGNGH